MLNIINNKSFLIFHYIYWVITLNVSILGGMHVLYPAYLYMALLDLTLALIFINFEHLFSQLILITRDLIRTNAHNHRLHFFLTIRIIIMITPDCYQYVTWSKIMDNFKGNLFKQATTERCSGILNNFWSTQDKW